MYVITSVVLLYYCVFFFKQKTAYEMRISDWSSDVCVSDLVAFPDHGAGGNVERGEQGCRAIADVGMGAPLRNPRRHGQDRLLAIQRLDLRFFIHAQHDRPVRRRHVEPDYVLHLVDK